MKTTRKPSEFQEAYLDTPCHAVCVKTRDFKIDGPLDQCGILVQPAIRVGDINGPDELAGLVAASGVSEVKVRGHAWMADEVFVWTGTVQEFNDKWVVD